jgi:deaminated glutathione amidase
MAGDRLTVALAQFPPNTSFLDNVQQIREFAQKARAEGADVVVCPEYAQAFSPNQGPEWSALAQPLDGEFVRALTEASNAAEGIVIIAGMLVAGDTKPFNTIVAVGPSGVMVRSEKLHLYDAFGTKESQWVTPGAISPPEILVLGEHKIGLMACYDLRFPEVARRLVDAGATCLVVPAQWVPGPHKVEHWTTLLGARAIENQSFVAATGQPLPHGVGHSMVLGPLGETLLAMGQSEGLGLATLDLTLVREARENNPGLQARRFDVIPKK